MQSNTTNENAWLLETEENRELQTVGGFTLQLPTVAYQAHLDCCLTWLFVYIYNGDINLIPSSRDSFGQTSFYYAHHLSGLVTLPIEFKEDRSRWTCYHYRLVATKRWRLEKLFIFYVPRYFLFSSWRWFHIYKCNLKIYDQKNPLSVGVDHVPETKEAGLHNIRVRQIENLAHRKAKSCEIP